MKISLFTITLSCILVAAAMSGGVIASEAAANDPSSAAAPESETEQTQALLYAFYTDYCTLIAESSDNFAAEQKLLDSVLTPQVRRKVTQVRTEQFYDPIIRAQDFNPKALATISVTHVDGDWYAAAYLDCYNNKCVVVPVKATVENGALKITDIAIQ